MRGVWWFSAIVGTVWLAACAVKPLTTPSLPPVVPAPKPVPLAAPGSQATGPLVAPAVQAISRTTSQWVPVPWSELPGWSADNLAGAWSAWMASCQRAVAPWTEVCSEARTVATGSDGDKRAWMQRRLQPYRVESLQGVSLGLLTAYFEPVFEASRNRSVEYAVPLYQPPAKLNRGQTWYSRKEIDTLPQAQAALQGRVIAYMADPLDAMALHIQGSGRMDIRQADGTLRQSRLAYAANNGHPYQSVGTWLIEQGLSKDTSWPGIKAWAARNPSRVNELLWRNPRVVFFQEEALTSDDAGPRGAQGVPLTAGRSIAVDPNSIPYGTPVWISSSGAQTSLQKLVVAQDTGSAITGTVRADYFAGTGPAAGELAGRLKQPLQMWVLWPQ